MSSTESYAARLAAQCITEEELEKLKALLRQMEEAFQQKDFLLLCS